MKKFPLLLSTIFTMLLFAGCDVATAPAVEPHTSSSTLTVHFIDVGQADSALLTCGDETMLIDGGNVPDSSLVVSYLQQQGIDHLNYVVDTHAHEDHVGGLPGPLNTCKVEHVLAPVTEYDSKAFRDFVKYTTAQGLNIEIPQPDETFALGDAQVTVLGPRKDYDDTNNTSIVLRVEFGETTFLFTGDMERSAESDLLEAPIDLSATVLKVGHHGSDTSTTYPFLREVMPEYAVISVGEDNSYGHPSDNTLSRLRDADVTVYRTDLQGTVIATSDGKTITFSTSKDSLPTAGREEQSTISYIGNAKSKVLHLETCSSLPEQKNRVSFSSRDEATTAGYTLCGRCKP